MGAPPRGGTAGRRWGHGPTGDPRGAARGTHPGSGERPARDEFPHLAGLSGPAPNADSVSKRCALGGTGRMIGRRRWLGLGIAMVGAGMLAACGSGAAAQGPGANGPAGGSSAAAPGGSPGTAVEDFTEYGSDDDLNKAWIANPSGDQITASLSKTVKADGRPAMEMDFTVGGKGYSGLEFNTNQDWSKAKGVQFVYQGDGGGAGLTFQFKDGNGEYWEANATLSDKKQHTAQFTWASFHQASWNQNPGNALDANALAAIGQVSFYFGGKSGTCYVGDIRAV